MGKSSDVLESGTAAVSAESANPPPPHRDIAGRSDLSNEQLEVSDSGF